MKAAVLVLALVCGSALAGADWRAEVTPTQKVIDLLNAMLEKGKKEKNDEGVAFAAYKQFCDDTSTEKNRAITEAEELLASLNADIEKYTSDAARLEKEIAGHNADISAWTGDENAATKVRQLEKADYDKTHKDYSESVDALGRAIAVLKKQLSSSKSNTDLGSLLQVKTLSLIPPEAKRSIDAFLSQDASLSEDLDLNAAEAMDAAPEASQYEFQSNHIIEMLEKLESKFVDEKTNLEKEEKESVHAYKMLMQDLAAQIGAANDDVKEKTEFRTSCLEKKAECEANVADTTATKKADSKYLADLTATCSQKSKDFESRQELRAGEIEAIEKAIEILSSDSVSGAADKHLPTLVQQSQFLKAKGDHLVTSLAQLRSDSVSINQARVVKFLQKQAEALHSRVLNVVAQRAESDPFKKVKKMISDLIDKLSAEASEEADQKGFCDEELATNEQTRKEKTAAAEATHAEIDELHATIAKLGDEIAQLTADNVKTQEAMTKATTIRQDEKEKNTQAIKDAKEAQAAVARAMTVLKEFYAKAAEATAFVQEDPQIFESSYKGMQSESGGIVGMLEVIESDFARLEAETSASEAANAKEYDEFMEDSTTSKKENQKDIEHKTATKQDKNQSLVLAKEDLEGTQSELSAALDEYEKLKSSCLDSKVDYEDRVARREQEIESLQQALKILNGEDI